MVRPDEDDEWRVPLRLSLVLRGGGYGFAAGAVGGGLLGGGIGVLGGLPYLVIGAITGGILGTAVGLVAGLVGGAAFAVGMPCLVRHPRAVRPAGAAVLPGIMFLLWAAFLLSHPTSDLEPLAYDETWLFIAAVMAIGAVAGALTAPWVLYGASPPSGDEPRRDGDPRRGTGAEGADSPG